MVFVNMIPAVPLNTGPTASQTLDKNPISPPIFSEYLVQSFRIWGRPWAQLVEALRYKPEGRGFFSRWCHWNFSLTFWPHYDPGVDSASNRNEYQEYFLGGKGGRCVWLMTLPPSCAGYLEVLEASTSWNHQSLCRPVGGLPCYHL
jgi:hypothetical protein